MNFRHVEPFSSSHICQRWRNFRFISIFHMAIFENTPHVEKYQISPHHAKKSEISPPDKFFSTCLAGDTSSTVKKMRKFYATKKNPHRPIFSISFTFTFLSTFSFNLKTISSNLSSTKLHTALSTWSYTLDILAIYRDYL